LTPASGGNGGIWTLEMYLCECINGVLNLFFTGGFGSKEVEESGGTFIETLTANSIFVLFPER
jgi:hypothetical protein